jgi:hypothetical protein
MSWKNDVESRICRIGELYDSKQKVIIYTSPCSDPHRSDIGKTGFDFRRGKVNPSWSTGVIIAGMPNGMSILCSSDPILSNGKAEAPHPKGLILKKPSVLYRSDC